MTVVTLTRKNKPAWKFMWSNSHNGYIYSTKDNVYKIFFDNCLNKSTYDIPPDIWIGRLSDDGTFWFTCEKQIKAESILMFRGQYNFN